MKKSCTLLFLLLLVATGFSQKINLTDWQFRKAGTSRWYTATVPGSVHGDLLNNKLIADPFYAANESSTYWVDSADWEYRCVFDLPADMIAINSKIVFEGLDTYADVYLNNSRVLQADNMFRSWDVAVKKFLRPGRNTLRIYFHSAVRMNAALAKKNLPVVLPDDNRVYSRKAQYQSGWDWGLRLIGAGIYKPVYFTKGIMRTTSTRTRATMLNNIAFVQQQDTIGTSFYFTRNGKPLYVKGANWIPAHALPASAKREDYRELLIMAKEAGMNMLRVWGGGYYERSDFYELCDSLGLMVWQDYMFACRMYPGDKKFFANVKAEVREQLRRLSSYECIMLWCGNNEVDEGWHHWGWQNQFNLHGADSAKVWNDYVRLFRDSLRIWTEAFDHKKRPYISTSPQYGWGNPMSYKNGDSHYWGLWWGLEGWEKFRTHTGRFVSEWGMQAMPDYSTVKKYVPENERYLYSPSVNAHQKAGNGFIKLNHYVNKYFFDTTRLAVLSLEEYTYLTQCLQYYILKNSLATQMSQPANMGTLIWQLNDCWPVTSWSLIDFYRQPKAGYYAAKRAFDTMDTVTDKIYPKDLALTKPAIKVTVAENGFSIYSDVAAKYVFVDFGAYNKYVATNYFDLEPEEVLFVPFRKGIVMKDKPYKVFTLYDILSK
ncbi:MAG: hypothetical protein QM687_09425 [Ferruginibacter sp.]